MVAARTLLLVADRNPARPAGCGVNVSETESNSDAAGRLAGPVDAPFGMGQPGAPGRLAAELGRYKSARVSPHPFLHVTNHLPIIGKVVWLLL